MHGTNSCHTGHDRQASVTEGPPQEGRGNVMDRPSSTDLVVQATGGRDPPEPEEKALKGHANLLLAEIIPKLETASTKEQILNTLEPWSSVLFPRDVHFIIGFFRKKGDWQRALEVFNWMRSQRWYMPKVKTYGAMIDVMRQADRVDHVEHLFQLMKKESIEPDVYIYAMVISSLGKACKLQKAIMVFEEAMRRKCTANAIMCATVMDCYSRLGLVEEVEKVWEGMKRDGVACDIVAFNVALKIYGRLGKFEKIDAVRGEMQQAGCEPDVISYNILLDSYGKMGKLDRMEEIWEDMQQRGLQASIITYNTLISIYGKAGRFDKVDSLLGMLEARKMRANLMTYSVRISGFARWKRLEEMEKVFGEMVAAGFRPNAHVISVMIGAYGNAGEMDKVERVLEKIWDLPQRRPVDAMFYRTVLELYRRERRYRDAERVWKELQLAQVQGNEPLYSSMLHICAGGGRWRKMESVWNEMRRAGCTPSWDTWNALAIGYARSGRLGKMVKALEDIRKTRMKPSNETIAAVIAAYARAGLFKEIERVKVEFVSSAGGTDAQLCHAFMRAYGRAGLFEQMENWLFESTSNGFRPTSQTSKIVLDAYGRAGKMDLMEAKVKQLQESGCTIDKSSYVWMAGYYTNDLKLEKAKRALEMAGEAPGEVPAAGVLQVAVSALTGAASVGVLQPDGERIVLETNAWLDVWDPMAARVLRHLIGNEDGQRVGSSMEWGAIAEWLMKIGARVEVDDERDLYDSLVDLLWQWNRRQTAEKVMLLAMGHGVFPFGPTGEEGQMGNSHTMKLDLCWFRKDHAANVALRLWLREIVSRHGLNKVAQIVVGDERRIRIRKQEGTATQVPVAQLWQKPPVHALKDLDSPFKLTGRSPDFLVANTAIVKRWLCRPEVRNWLGMGVDSVDSAVGSAVDSLVTAALDSAVHSRVNSEANSAVNSAFDSTADPASRSSADSEIDDNVEGTGQEKG
ncbi:hypothetical protein CBR_g45232 [Chara braunii]|uniref:PROP1-like PPR domain-containing protein n=1 Tax=Chara braunii TaxID=69332 RepID=A0A388K3D0_CHABU|nr:hypothetical protein CBR_g45232 [Chara braunii]|eukprot:GBG64536.1 hypothetical protein CBR_g45232 [Chara braunii]